MKDYNFKIPFIEKYAKNIPKKIMVKINNQYKSVVEPTPEFKELI